MEALTPLAAVIERSDQQRRQQRPADGDAEMNDVIGRMQSVSISKRKRSDSDSDDERIVKQSRVGDKKVGGQRPSQGPQRPLPSSNTKRERDSGNDEREQRQAKRARVVQQPRSLVRKAVREAEARATRRFLNPLLRNLSRWTGGPFGLTWLYAHNREALVDGSMTVDDAVSTVLSALAAAPHFVDLSYELTAAVGAAVRLACVCDLRLLVVRAERWLGRSDYLVQSRLLMLMDSPDPRIVALRKQVYAELGTDTVAAVRAWLAGGSDAGGVYWTRLVNLHTESLSSEDLFFVSYLALSRDEQRVLAATLFCLNTNLDETMVQGLLQQHLSSGDDHPQVLGLPWLAAMQLLQTCCPTLSADADTTIDDYQQAILDALRDDMSDATRALLIGVVDTGAFLYANRADLEQAVDQQLQQIASDDTLAINRLYELYTACTETAAAPEFQTTAQTVYFTAHLQFWRRRPMPDAVRQSLNFIALLVRGLPVLPPAENEHLALVLFAFLARRHDVYAARLLLPPLTGERQDARARQLVQLVLVCADLPLAEVLLAQTGGPSRISLQLAVRLVFQEASTSLLDSSLYESLAGGLARRRRVFSLLLYQLGRAIQPDMSVGRLLGAMPATALDLVVRVYETWKTLPPNVVWPLTLHDIPAERIRILVAYLLMPTTSQHPASVIYEMMLLACQHATQAAANFKLIAPILVPSRTAFQQRRWHSDDAESYWSWVVRTTGRDSLAYALYFAHTLAWTAGCTPQDLAAFDNLIAAVPLYEVDRARLFRRPLETLVLGELQAKTPLPVILGPVQWLNAPLLDLGPIIRALFRVADKFGDTVMRALAAWLTLVTTSPELFVIVNWIVVEHLAASDADARITQWSKLLLSRFVPVLQALSAAPDWPQLTRFRRSLASVPSATDPDFTAHYGALGLRRLFNLTDPNVILRIKGNKTTNPVLWQLIQNDVY